MELTVPAVLTTAVASPTPVLSPPPTILEIVTTGATDTVPVACCSLLATNEAPPEKFIVSPSVKVPLWFFNFIICLVVSIETTVAVTPLEAPLAV